MQAAGQERLVERCSFLACGDAALSHVRFGSRQGKWFDARFMNDERSMDDELVSVSRQVVKGQQLLLLLLLLDGNERRTDG